MRNRRQFLGAVMGTTGSIALAGCAGFIQEAVDETTPHPTETPSPAPDASWTEEIIGRSAYRVSVDVRLNGAEMLEVRKGTPSEGSLITTIRSSGGHTIAGPETAHGPIDLGQTLYLIRPKESKIEGVASYDLVSQHMAGTQEQVSFPGHLYGLNGNTGPDLDAGDPVTRTYTQMTDHGMTELTLQIPNILYKYYQRRERVGDYGAYVSDSYDNRYIDSLVSEFETYGEQNGLSSLEIINHMMKFVQNLEYTTDEVSAGFNEYPKYPIETLFEEEGDCEDTSILLASMLREFGYDVVLLGFRSEQHMALGLAGEEGIPGTYFEQNGRRYYYVETTKPGWEIGQAPESIQGARAQIMAVNDHAVLVFSYAVSPRDAGGVNVEVSVRNVGDAPGNSTVQVSFENRAGEVVASGTSEPTSVAPDQEYTTTLELSPPEDEELRARVSVLLDGTKHDSLTSEWREPV